jgi:hypothetical protein
MLSHSHPYLFNRTTRIKKIVEHILDRVVVENRWQVEIAVMLSHIGYIQLPEEITQHISAPQLLDEKQREKLENAFISSAALIKNIPRLEAVADIIKFTASDCSDTRVPRNSCLLKIAIDFDNLLQQGNSPKEAVEFLLKHQESYDNDFLQALVTSVENNEFTKDKVLTQVTVEKLQSGMFFGENIVSKSGITIANKGQTVTPTLINAMHTYYAKREIPFEVKVFLTKNR